MHELREARDPGQKPRDRQRARRQALDRDKSDQTVYLAYKRQERVGNNGYHRPKRR